MTRLTGNYDGVLIFLGVFDWVFKDRKVIVLRPFKIKFTCLFAQVGNERDFIFWTLAMPL